MTASLDWMVRAGGVGGGGVAGISLAREKKQNFQFAACWVLSFKKKYSRCSLNVNQFRDNNCGIVALSFGFLVKQLLIASITYLGTGVFKCSNFVGDAGVPFFDAGSVGTENSGKSISCSLSGIAYIFW